MIITNIKSITNKIERERERLNEDDRKIIDRDLLTIYNELVGVHAIADSIVTHY